MPCTNKHQSATTTCLSHGNLLPTLLSPTYRISQEAEHAFWMDFERGRAVCVPAPPPPPTTSDAMMSPYHYPHHHYHGRMTATATTTTTTRQPEGAAVLLNRYWGALAPPAEEPVGLGLDDSPGGGRKGVGGPLPSRPPRPESYREDAAAASGVCACGRGGEGEGGGSEDTPSVESVVPTAVDGSTGSWGGEGGKVSPGGRVDRCYGMCHELAAAAESGWDFSSRWAGVCSRGTRSRGRTKRVAAAGRKEFSGENDGVRAGGESNENDGKKTKKEGGVFCLCESATTSVVPVDLNAFLHRAELNIARLHHALALAGRAKSEESEPDFEGAAAAPESGGQPPLLSLDQIQRRFLSHRRGGGGGLVRGSWSSSSSSLMEKLSHQGDVGFASAADEDAGDGGGGCGGGGDEPLPAGGESLPLSRRTMLFLAAARARAKAIEQTMWDGGSALWRDVLLPTGGRGREYFRRGLHGTCSM